MSENRQEGGSHYLSMAVQPWEAIQAWLTPEEWQGYLKGSAISYLARNGVKDSDPMLDVMKAHHYLDKLIDGLQTESTAAVGSLTPKRFMGWSVVYRNGYYKLFKKVAGKVRGIHIGKAWNAEEAKVRITIKLSALNSKQ